MDSVSVHGSITVGGDCGGCGGDSTVVELGLAGGGGCGCSSLSYESVVSKKGIAVATIGAIGAKWADIHVLGDFTAIELLFVETTAKVRFRFNPTRPELVGTLDLPSGGIVAGAMTLTVTDETGVQYTATVTFSGATNTPELVVSAINAALGALGAPQPPDGPVARLNLLKLELVSPGIGPDAFVELAAGAPSTLGLGTALVRDTGEADVTPVVYGTQLMQFPRSPDAPAQIQVSGVASLNIVAAGRVST